MKQKPTAKRFLRFSRFFDINISFKPSQETQSFLRFSIVLLLISLFFDIIIDITLECDLTKTQILMKIALFISILVPNVLFLLLLKIYPIKNFILITTLMITGFILRLFLEKLLDFQNFDFEILPMCLSSLPLYTIFILLAPKSKFLVFLVFFHEMVIFLFLNLMVDLAWNNILKLLISFFTNLTIFWKVFAFSLSTEKLTENTKKSSINIQNDWKNLVDSIPQGIIIISQSREILYSNDFSLDLLDLDTSTIQSKLNRYQSIVQKFGKLEEIQYLIKNSDESKREECGFIINESSLSCYKRNTKAKAIFGVNPVNIISNRLYKSSKFKISGPISSANRAFFGTNGTKERIDLQKTKDFDVRVGNSAKISLREKVFEKSEFLMDSFKNFSPQSVIPFREIDLDSILNRMTTTPSKTFKCFYSESLETNKKRLELKIKNVSFENSSAFLLTFQDVSYLTFFKRICENNEYKNKVLTTLSHELKTPLNGALVPLEKLLNERLEKNDEVHEGVDIAYKSMILLQNVINDVVDFALINSNQLYLNYEELDIFAFFDHTVDLFRKQAQEKGLFLEIVISENLGKISRVLKLDFQRLRQILVSLLNNALKNTFEGGISLYVSLAEKSDSSKDHYDFLRHCLKIVIKDTGVGIDDEKLNRIKSCLRTKDLMKCCDHLNKNKGCGLGLIISHCLALILGPLDSKGLKVNSKAMSGSEFSFEFEAIQEKEEERLVMIEEKTREVSDFNFSTTHTTAIKKKDKTCIETETKVISNEDFITSVISRGKKLCESERSTLEIINFIHTHTLQTKKMSEIVGNRCEILIADDDSFNLMAMEAILSKFNVKSVRAFNGQQALDKILEKHVYLPNSQAFSMVFLDFHMPIKNGVETTQDIMKLFEQDGFIRFPIIGCTAFAAKDLFEEWSNAGVSDLVIKPLNFQKIEGLLRKFDVLK